MAAYKIIDVEGIGPVYAEKLLAAGIKDTDILLEKCAKPAGRKALEEETGISGKLILTWANHADLIRINGIGPQFAELLEAAGVDTVKELRNRKPENLQPKLVEVNEEKHLVGRVPALKEVQRMVAEAAELPPMMEY
jgi:predicted flap endonuclease-1-like 5' DNA nuclease